MPIRRPRRALWYALGVNALVLVLGLGAAVYRTHTPGVETVSGSPARDSPTYVEITAQIGSTADAGSPAPAVNPIIAANPLPHGGITIVGSADSGDRNTASPGTSEADISLAVDRGRGPASSALQPSTTDPTTATDPTGLSIGGDGGAVGSAGMVPLAATGASAGSFGASGPTGASPANSRSPGVPGANSKSGSPSLALPAAAPVLDGGFATPPTGSTPPGARAPQAGPDSINAASSVARSAPTGSPVGSPGLRAPAQTMSGGAATSIGGVSPLSTIVPGQTPGFPITPIGNTPNGTAILPVAGAGCTGASCGGHAWQFFDPLVAIGYNYQLQPTVADQSLTFGIVGIMPTTSVGSGIYDLWLYDVLTGTYVDSRSFSATGQTITIAADPSANPNEAFDVVQFLLSLNLQQDQELGVSDPNLGLTQFSLRGIDPKAGLDPENPNTFITGLLFAGDINGDLLITPLAVDSVTNLAVDPPSFRVAIPEPATIALFITALAGLWFLDRRSHRSSRCKRSAGSV